MASQEQEVKSTEASEQASSDAPQAAAAGQEEALNPAFHERSTPAEFAGVSLRGVLMGGADVIPGVSGGTMALILGIYRELVASIRAFDIAALKLLARGNIGGFSRHVNLAFLIALFIGIGAAIVSLARIMPKLLRTYPAPVNGLFFGLILASIVIVWRQVEETNQQAYVLAGLGAVGAYILVGLMPTQTPDHLGFIFLCGCIAICAMILPGISGAFLLLLMGKYAFILDALSQFVHTRKLDHNFLVVIVFIAGCACGIMAFSRLLHWLLEEHHGPTLALLTGLMLGSLRRIWPFQTGGEEMKGAELLVSNYLWPFEKDIALAIQKKSLFLENVWPSHWTSQSILAIILLLFGVIFVFAIDRYAERAAEKRAS